MQIARVKVYDGRHGRFVRANVFFDTGSNKSYVSREFVEKKLSLNMKVLNMSHMCLLVQRRLVRVS